MYMDSLGINKKIGAAAVLMCPNGNPKKARYHLGTDSEHMVYEAELVALTLAVYLLYTERDINFPVHIFVDNQAAIKSSDNPTSKPGHYLITKLHRLLRAVHRKYCCSKEEVIIQWVAGHQDVQDNTLADEEAKRATLHPDSTSSPSCLPP